MATLIKVTAPPPLPPLPATTDKISPALAKRLHFGTDAALKQGIHIMGGPGSGKSRFLGRVFAWQALVRRIPGVIFDPTGQVSNNVFDKLSRLPPAFGEGLSQRIIYVKVGDKASIVPNPLYKRYSSTESYADIANRFVSVLTQQDPKLEQAPLMGKNPLAETASYAGQIAAALGLQIEFVYELVKHPNRYTDLLTYAVTQDPELARAANYFRELADPDHKGLHERKTVALLSKLHPFLSDQAVRATFNAVTPAIDWAAVVRQGQLVLLDFSQEWDTERRQFQMLWWLNDFTTFIKHRGAAGRGEEAILGIDEITQLLGYKKVAGESILAQEIEELTTVLGRNFGVNVVIAHQNLRQIDERIQTALMQMGNQVLFHLDHPDDTYLLARYLLNYDPYKVKHREQHWVMMKEGTAAWLDPGGTNINGEPYRGAVLSLFDRDVPFPLGETVTYFTPEEIFLGLADNLRALKRFQFYLRPATAEGQIDQRLYLLTLENLDPGEYPDVQALQGVREYLRQQSGRPVDAVLAEMAAHTRQVLKAAKQARVTATKTSEKALAPSGTIGRPSDDTTRHPLPRTTPTNGHNATGTPTKPAAHSQAEDDDIFG